MGEGSSWGFADSASASWAIFTEFSLNRHCTTIIAIFAGVFIFATAARAQQSAPLNKDFDEKPWEEQKQQLPDYPKESNLKQIDIGPITSFRFFVDMESVNVGTDGVVRFTLTARSASGASNVSFEGLRCKTQEKKIYALGRANGNWVAAKNRNWIVLERQNVNPVYTVLYEDFFCPEGNIVSSTLEAVESLKNGGNQRGRSRR